MKPIELTLICVFSREGKYRQGLGTRRDTVLHVLCVYAGGGETGETGETHVKDI